MNGVAIAIRERAIAQVMAREGGFVDDPHDPGGATQWGISLRWLRTLGEIGDLDGDGDVDADDIRRMTRAQAEAFYREYWWAHYGYERLCDAEIAIKVMDLSVNMGARQAHKLLQRALYAARLPVAIDGVLGPKTVLAANTARPHLLLGALRATAAHFYIGLGKPRYLAGWLRRAFDDYSIEVDPKAWGVG